MYTKIVLTVIAAALACIVVQNEMRGARAIGSSCGGNSFEPCYVKIEEDVTGFPVYVRNWPHYYPPN